MRLANTASGVAEIDHQIQAVTEMSSVMTLLSKTPRKNSLH